MDRYWGKGVGFVWYLDDGNELDHAEENKIEVIGNIHENPELLKEKQ